MNDELLIETVRIYSVLYDLSNPKYMDCKYKNQIWREIGRKLNYEPSRCKSRWYNIRDQYRKSLNKTKTKSGQSSKKVKLYKYHDLMSFLQPYFNERDAKTNLSFTDDSAEDSNSNVRASVSSESMQEPNMDTFSAAVNSPEPPLTASMEMSPPSSLPISPRASSIMTSAQERNDKPRSSAASLMEFVLKKNLEKTEHPVDKFLEGIAPTLKALTPYYQNLAKSDIFGIVQNYEMAMLTENQQQSTQISATDAVSSNDNIRTNEISVIVSPNTIIETSELVPDPDEGAELVNLRDYVVKFVEK